MKINYIYYKKKNIYIYIFFANICGKDTESALPMLNLLDMLTVYNIYSLHVLKFVHLWHKGLLPDVFRNTFQYASEVHSYNTRYATQKNLYKPRVRTNTGKQLISFKATDLWKSIPQNLKDLNVYTFSKNIKKNSPCFVSRMIFLADATNQTHVNLLAQIMSVPINLKDISFNVGDFALPTEE